MIYIRRDAMEKRWMFPRMPYVSKMKIERSQRRSVPQIFIDKLHVVDSRYTRLNRIPVLRVWPCSKMPQNISSRIIDHGIFHGIYISCKC